MKISIRKSVFETNSSSMHSLIITNEKNKDEDLKKHDEKLNPAGFYYDRPVINDKAEKVYFLAALFENDKDNFGFLRFQHKVFLKVLKDNNETELLHNIELHRHQYCLNRDRRYCCNYFCEDVLMDCDCNFVEQFNKYFGNINDTSYLLSDDVNEDNILDIATKQFELNDRNKRELYQRLYDFIYKDGVIIPYEYL